MRWTTRARRSARILAKVVWALLDRNHPLLVHLIPMRRCNLACAYCNEYDATSAPVPAGTPILYTFYIDNLGPSTATAVEMTDAITSNGLFVVNGIASDRPATCTPRCSATTISQPSARRRATSCR